eukprot:m51a1_g5275 putative translation initiation factor eif-2b alpha subunit (315) ;mRNA; f:156486-158279
MDAQKQSHAREPSVLHTQVSEYMKGDPALAGAVAVVRALTEVIENSKANTIMGLRDELQQEVEKFKDASTTGSVSLVSGCELFMRFVTRTTLDFAVFADCKQRLIERGKLFTQRLAQSRDKIANIAAPFIHDNCTVLVHGFSRVVLRVLQRAASQGRPFSVIVTESRPDNAGYLTATSLKAVGIPVRVIMDSAVAFEMAHVDLVLCGSEAIVENGGIINKIGTYQISIVAQALNKPFYVAAESFKFFRLYPLTQSEIPQRKVPFLSCEHCPADVSAASTESVDYTPPNYISLLFTELGVLTPSAVSDELIRLYA